MAIHRLFFYLTILLLPTQLGRHFWPQWAFILGRRIDYLAPTVCLTDLTVIAAVLIWMMKKDVRMQLMRTIRRNGVFIGAGLVIIGINVLCSSSIQVSLYMWIKVLEYVLLFYYIVKTKPSWMMLSYLATVGVIYTSVIAITQFFLHHSIGGPLWLLGERTFSITTPGIAKSSWCFFSTNSCQEQLRPYATLPHPNVLGGLLATTIPFIISSLEKERQRTRSAIKKIAIMIGLFTLALTYSRSAWIIGALTIGTAVVLMRKKQLSIFRMVLLGSIVIGLICAMPYIQTLQGESESVAVRLDLSHAAWNMIQRHWVTGVGLGTFLINLPSVISTRSLFFLQPVHTSIMLWVTETGITGIGMIGISAYLYMKKYMEKKRNIRLCLPILALLVIGLFDHYPITLQQGQLLTTIFLALPFLDGNT